MGGRRRTPGRGIEKREGQGRAGGRGFCESETTTWVVKAIFHPEADEEFQNSIEVYQAESSELGLRFYGAVMAAAAKIGAHPQAWPRLRGEVRKCLVEDFPYKLLYAIEADRIHVVAVMHAKRNPDYWIERME
jgi:toxin ParE1/3/4